MLPRVIFKEMSLKENVENIKWMFFDTNGEFSIRDAVIQYFPDLKESINLETKEEIYSNIEKLIKECYEYSLEKIKLDVKKYNDIWREYNDNYFSELAKYLNIDWPSDKLVIVAKVGLIPVFPRYLDDFSFDLSFSLNKENVVEVTAHETLHFLWFEKWKQLFLDSKREEYDSPHLVWRYSEMVTDPILNSKPINEVLKIEEKAYDSFYNIKDGNCKMMEKLISIYHSNISIEDKIIKGFEYIKTVLEK